MKPKISVDPDFSRFKKTLLREKADRIPLFDFNIDIKIKQEIIGRPIRTPEDEVDFWMQAGYDYIQVRLDPLSEHIVAPFAPGEDGQSDTLAPNQGMAGGTLDKKKLEEDTFPWTEAYKGEWDLDNAYNLAHLKAIARVKPDSMKLIVHGADIFTRSWIAMGFEPFCLSLYEDPELAAELFRQNYIAEQRRFDILFEELGDAIGGVLYSDDIAYTGGLMLSPEIYRQYLFPYMEKLFRLPLEENLPIIYHTDGRLWDVFDDFLELGVCGIQPLEPKSMDLGRLKAERGKQFCLIGSVDIDLLSRGKPEEVDAMVKERIGTLGYDGIYMVGTSNTVPYYVDVKNYITMIEAARKYGTF
jgi:uroporphyrinogen decarboxylase